MSIIGEPSRLSYIHMNLRSDGRTTTQAAALQAAPLRRPYLFGSEDGYVTIEASIPLTADECSISHSGTVAWRPAKQQVKFYDVRESRLAAYYDQSAFQGISIEAVLEDESVSRVLQLNLTIFDKEGIPLRSFSGGGTPSNGTLLFSFPILFAINRKDIASYEISVSDMCWESVP